MVHNKVWLGKTGIITHIVANKVEVEKVGVNVINKIRKEGEKVSIT